MSDDRFTAIIVGAGPAGSTAAYLLAKEGHEVLLIEKGAVPGAKNMFGGRMYAHALNRIIPGFWEEAPVERPVVREIITFLDGGRSTSVNCRDAAWAEAPYHSFTLLRAEFDAWLAAKAEEAGAMLACNIRVDDLLYENGRVAGIRAGEDEMFADVVIAADGVNSILAQKAGLAKMFSAGQVATGVKQIIELPAEEISHRFGLEGNEGAAQLFVGDCTRECTGGGSCTQTGRAYRWLGREYCGTGEKPNPCPRPHRGLQGQSGNSSPDRRRHGCGILRPPDPGGGPRDDAPALFGRNPGCRRRRGLRAESGLYRARDGFCDRLGRSRRRRRHGRQGERGFFGISLEVYRKLLAESFVLRDLEAYRKAPGFTANRRLYETYPEFVTSLASRLFTVDGSTPVHLLGKVWDHVRKNRINLVDLAADGWKGAKWL